MTTTIRLWVDWNQDGNYIDEGDWTVGVDGRVGFAAPWEQIADVGRMRVELDNSTGRYAPGNAAGPLFGKLLPGREAIIRADDGSQFWVIFAGRIERLEVSSGTGRATVHLVDGMDVLRRAMAIQVFPVTETLENVVGGLVTGAYKYWDWSDYAFEGEVLHHVGQRWFPETVRVWDALNEAVRTWQGRFWIARWRGPSYRGRGFLQAAIDAPVLAFGVGVEYANQLDVELDVARVVNVAQVVTYPTETVAAESELWAAGGVIRIGPGETVERWAPFSNAAGERCAAVDVVTPVAFTDYRVSEFRDGTGVDYTVEPSFGLVFDLEPTRAKLTFSNTALGALYVQFFKVRGKPVIEYAPVVVEDSDAASESAYGRRERVFDLPMQADDLFAQDLARYQVSRFGAATLNVRRAVFRDRDVIGGVNLYGIELMDMVSVTDADSGLSGGEHRVIAIEYKSDSVDRSVVFHLERADEVAFFMLDRVGRSELDGDARLGY